MDNYVLTKFFTVSNYLCSFCKYADIMKSTFKKVFNMKIIIPSKLIKTFTSAVILISLFHLIPCADLSEVPKDSLYFTNGKFTVIDTEKYPDFLFARSGIKKTIMIIDKMRNSVYLVPNNGPQIPIHAKGFELQHLDRLKTGVDSRVQLMITPKIQITLGEKTTVLFYQKQNKFYFKVEVGNARISASEITAENKYFLETNEFFSEINIGDFVCSVSKTEGSTLFSIIGDLPVEVIRKTSLILVSNDIVTQTKSAELKRSKLNNHHKVFVEDELNFNFISTNQGVSLNELVSSILAAPKDLLTRLSSGSSDEKGNAQLFDEVATYIYQSKSMSLISRGEAQAVARIIISYGKNLNSLKLAEPNGEGNNDDYLKELQNQMLLKANKLKELEEQLLREAAEAEAKAKAIK